MATLSQRGDGVPDPQRTSARCSSVAVDRAGKVRALDSYQVLKHQREIDAYAIAILAEVLWLRGFAIARVVDATGQASRELADVPDVVLGLASSRRLRSRPQGPP